MHAPSHTQFDAPLVDEQAHAHALVRVTHDRLAWAFVLLGCLACTVRYALGFPLIPDEAALAISFARRGYEGLLSPLDFGQVAPPLFVMVEEFSTRLFGFNEWSLRAFPFVSALGAMVMFRFIARRVLSGWAFVLAVAVFSVSYWPLRYSAEVKPYAVDMLFACAWMLLALKWMAAERPAKYLLLLCPLALVGLGFSFPSVFVGGGAVAYMVLARRGGGFVVRLVQPGVVGVCLLAGFVGVYGYLMPVRAEEASWMQDYWAMAFPPTDSVGAMAFWFLRAFSGELMPYPVGGENYASSGTLLFVIIGTAMLIRGKRWGVLVLLAGPLALGIIAAFLHKYPFGTPTRLQLYLAPVFCLLAGQGLASSFALVRAPAWRSPTRVACVALACIAIATMVKDVLVPYKASTDQALREASKLIWSTSRFDGPRPLSLREDLGAAFVPEPEGMHSEFTRFLINYHIRVERESEAESKRAIEPGQPVEVVTFYVDGRVDEAMRQDWIAQFEQAHGLRLERSGLLTIPHVGNHEELLRYDRIEILRFEPAATAIEPEVPAPSP